MNLEKFGGKVLTQQMKIQIRLLPSLVSYQWTYKRSVDFSHKVLYMLQRITTSSLISSVIPKGRMNYMLTKCKLTGSADATRIPAQCDHTLQSSAGCFLIPSAPWISHSDLWSLPANHSFNIAHSGCRYSFVRGRKLRWNTKPHSRGGFCRAA